jgi:hypothetical protein
MPEFELANAGESIDESESKFRHTPDGSGEGRQRRPKTEDHLAIRPRVAKKPRGRLRKQKCGKTRLLGKRDFVGQR